MGLFVFKLPDVGEGTAEAELVTWNVKIGDAVQEDQLLAEVMTDKATVEITSPVAGVVVALHGEPGQMVPVRGPLVEFETEGAAIAEAAPDRDVQAKPAAEPSVAPIAPPIATPPSPAAEAEADHVFKLPDVGEGTAEAELVTWHVKIGDTVQEDQLLAEVMTDKATVEITSPVAGVVVALHGEPGRPSAVGGPLVSFHTGRGAPAPTATPAAPAKAAPAPKPAARAGSADISAKPAARPVPAVTGRAPGERPLASPAVRQRARDLGVDLTFVPGSGPAGRIGHDDLDAYVARGGVMPAAEGAAAPSRRPRTAVEEVPVIGLRRKIAEKMQAAKRRIPHFMYAEEVDVTELEALRQHLNATNKGTDRPKLTLLPFIAAALVKVLPDYPQINATYDDEAGILHRHAGVHLGIAAQTPNGLMVPVVRHAEALDLYGFAAELARVSNAAKAGKATRDELSGSTITLTSLGPLGGVVHTPVINHPEVAIVGPNRIVERVVSMNGQFVVRKMMNISSSFDHRIVDGYDAAEFIQKIKGLLEHPAALFMD